MIDWKSRDCIEEAALKNGGNNQLHGTHCSRSSELDAENVDRHRGRFAAHHAAAVLSQSDFRILHLTLVGFVAKLPEDFANLRDASRAHGMTFREQTARRI